MKRILALALCLLMCLSLLPAAPARAEDDLALEEITDEDLIEILDETEDDEIVLVDEEGDAETEPGLGSALAGPVGDKEGFGYEALHIEPLYRSVISEEQLAGRLDAVSAAAAAEAELQAEQVTNENYCGTFAEAVSYLKSRMLNRDETVSFLLSYDAVTLSNTMFAKMFDSATAYSDSCSGREADALRWGNIGWGARATASHTASGVSCLQVEYNFLWTTTLAQENALTNKVNSVKGSLGGQTERDKILKIHDYICDHVDYDFEHLDEGADYPLQFSAYAALCQGKAVCQGYAILFYRFAKEAGLSVRVITSADHAWNIVRIGEVYYNIDTTWDGQDAETIHTWCLLGMRDFSHYNHIREEPFYSDEFEAQFPMVKDGKWDRTNLSRSFNNIDGGTVTSTASSKPKLLIFDKCIYDSELEKFLKEFLNYDLSGLNVLVIDVYKNTKSAVNTVRNRVAGTNARFCYDEGSGAYDSIFAYMDQLGYTSRPVVTPVFVFIDSNNKIQNYRVGLQGPATVAKLVKESLGVTLQYGAPRIKLQPMDHAAHYYSGETTHVEFNTEGVGPGKISYQWYYRTSSSGSWSKCGNGSGYNTKDYTVTVSKSRNGYQYRCAVSNPYGTTYTKAVTLRVTDEIKITAQPSDATGKIGATVQFSVKATGDGLSYQWYYSKPTDYSYGVSWTGINRESAKTDTLSVTVKEYHEGYLYKCEVKDSAGTYRFTEPAALHLAGPKIITQPTDQYAPAGNKVQFTVEAEGVDAYQWQYRTSSTGDWYKCSSGGYNTASYSVTVTQARDGYQYRCKLTNEDGTVYTKTARLTMMDLPVITSQPKSKTVSLGDDVYFEVKADNATSYHWLYRTTILGDWEPTSWGVSKYTTVASEENEGLQYCCEVRNYAKTLYSEVVTLYIKAYKKPSIAVQPVDTAVPGDETATFAILAKGGGLSYQWQYRKTVDSSWYKSTAEGADTAALNVQATAARDGYQYRCKVTNEYGTAYSKAVTLSVKPGITAQPTDQTVAVGDTAVFTVKAAGKNLSYQWQYRTGATGEWYKCSNGTEATLTVQALAYRSGYQYRCKVTNKCGTAYSDAATLSVKPGITTQPKSVTVSAGANASFTVKAEGAAGYQWQYRVNESGGWSNCSNGTAATLTVQALSYRSGYQYRCKVSNAAGTAISDAATLHIKPGVTTQPKSVTVSAGATVKFTVKAEGAAAYQWQYRTSATGEWYKCSDGAEAALSIEARAYRSGYQYRCKVSNAAGYVYTDAATLSVKPGVTTQPQSVTAAAGTTVKFTVKAEGATGYQWQYRTSATGDWYVCSNGAGATLSVEALAYRSGYQYRCKLTNDVGYVYTAAATLTVK